MKVKMLCRNPSDYVRETKKDVFKGETRLNLSNYIDRIPAKLLFINSF